MDYGCGCGCGSGCESQSEREYVEVECATMIANGLTESAIDCTKHRGDYGEAGSESARVCSSGHGRMV